MIPHVFSVSFLVYCAAYISFKKQCNQLYHKILLMALQIFVVCFVCICNVSPSEFF